MENFTRNIGILALSICLGFIANAVYQVGEAAQKVSDTFLHRQQLVIKLHNPGKWEQAYYKELDKKGFMLNVKNIWMQNKQDEDKNKTTQKASLNGLVTTTP